MGMDLGKQVGPLPVGAWIAVVAVGGGIAYVSRGKEQEYVGEYYEDISTDEGVGMGGGAVDWLPVSPIQNVTPVGSAIETNEDWQREVTNFLIAENYDPAIATRAIGKYLNEARLTMQERALLNIALREYGVPPVPPRGPFGGIPSPIPPKKRRKKKRKPNPPRNKPRGKGDKDNPKNDKRDRPGDGAKKPNIKYHIVRPGNTLSGIAMKHYGNPQRFRTIFEANKRGKRRADGSPGILANPNLIIPGQKLIIP